MATPTATRALFTPVQDRRSIGGLVNGDCVTPVLDLNCSNPQNAAVPDNDDEKEKRERHRQRLLEMQQQQLHSPVTPTNRRKSLGTGLAGLSNKQLAEHYTNCLKLFSENKISTKNAFGLNLIDYMAEMLKKKDSEMNDFQVASCTLDASAKIYAYRVDCIHQEIFKMAGGLGRSNKNMEGSGEREDQPLDEEGEGGNVEQPAKKRKTRKCCTIEKNLKNITIQQMDSRFEADPFLQKNTAAFDETGSAGLLMATLHTRDDSCELMLDSNCPVFIPSILTPRDTEPMELEAKVSLDDKDVKSLKICSEYSDFKFTSWKVEERIGQKSPEPEVKRQSNLTFQLDHVEEAVDQSKLSDDDVDDFQCAVGLDDMNDDDPLTDVTQLGHRDPEIINNFNTTRNSSVDLLDALEPSEYSYFNHSVLSAWAGPLHWKTKPISREKVLADPEGTRSRKGKKLPAKIKYSEETVDQSACTLKNKRPTTFKKDTMLAWKKNRTTLPRDMHYNVSNFGCLCNRPGVMVRKPKQIRELDVDVGQYDYNNAHDRVNYCPGLDAGDDSGSDDDDVAGFNPNLSMSLFGCDDDESIFPDLPIEGIPAAAAAFTGDNLLQPSYKVAKVDIQYAKTAKRIDVKRLKEQMWRVLCARDVTDAALDAGVPDIMKDELPFTTLYDKLPALISSKMADSLSVPIAFVCFLHLCNEKSLKLMPREDLSNFTILQD